LIQELRFISIIVGSRSPQ